MCADPAIEEAEVGAAGDEEAAAYGKCLCSRWHAVRDTIVMFYESSTGLSLRE